jgi:hypothetical protein
LPTPGNNLVGAAGLDRFATHFRRRFLIIRIVMAGTPRVHPFYFT